LSNNVNMSRGTYVNVTTHQGMQYKHNANCWLRADFPRLQGQNNTMLLAQAT
jgi:hypothetical protein